MVSLSFRLATREAADLAALYRLAASRRPNTRLATPSTERSVAAFSLIQNSCSEGEVVSAKQPTPISFPVIILGWGQLKMTL